MVLITIINIIDEVASLRIHYSNTVFAQSTLPERLQ